MSGRWIVVGAGSAGCVVASSLSEDPDNNVMLLESGEDRQGNARPSAITSLDWSSVVSHAELWWPGLTAFRASQGRPVPYLQGRGVGGSSSVNGMLSLPGLPGDYDRWERDHGCEGWGWRDVEGDFAELRSSCRQATDSELSPLDHGLEGAADELGIDVGVDLWGPRDGLGRAWLQASSQQRRTSAEVWLDPARSRDNLVVLGGTEVSRLVLIRNRVTGVQLSSGERVAADHVVLCAGAIGSPTILMRSGIERPGLGANLCEHPSVSVTVTVPDDRVRAASPPITTILRLSSSGGHGDLHILPMASVGAGGTARVIAACMTATSRGSVVLDQADPAANPIIRTNELSTAHDRSVVGEARAWVERLLSTSALDSLCSDVGAVEISDSMYHAAGTCRMGSASDPMAVVGDDGRVIGLEGVHVMDSSVLPDLPAAGPHLPVVMLASRLANRLRDNGESA